MSKTELLGELDTLSQLCAQWTATEYKLGDPDISAIYARKCFGHRLPEQTMWKIFRDGYTLNKQDDWEYEPTPSNRDKKYYESCRFSTLEDALKVLRDSEES